MRFSKVVFRYRHTLLVQRFEYEFAARQWLFIAAALKPFQATKTIGSVAGLPITLSKFDEQATLIVHGKSEYKANVSDSPAGAIASVEHALESMADRLRERETDLKQCHKQSADVTKQLDHPFEHEEKLTVATKRQQEIVDALDITKNQAAASVQASDEQEAMPEEQTIQSQSSA